MRHCGLPLRRDKPRLWWEADALRRSALHRFSILNSQSGFIRFELRSIIVNERETSPKKKKGDDVIIF
jgi:hypothetical protein